MDIPPITSSITTALDNGFSQLDKAAAELAAPANLSPPTDSVNVSSSMVGGIDSMISGVSDLIQAQVQVGAGVLLLHAYDGDRQRLFDMLNASGNGSSAC